MKVLIDGVEYIPAKHAIANYDACIQGIVESFWGNIGSRKEEWPKLMEGVYVHVTDDPTYKHCPSVFDVADKIAKFADEEIS